MCRWRITTKDTKDTKDTKRNIVAGGPTRAKSLSAFK